MPFSKFNVDPYHVEPMRAAFRLVCEALHLECRADDPITEIVVMKIVELSKAGDLSPERLCMRVLADLEAPPAGIVERLDDTGAGLK